MGEVVHIQKMQFVFLKLVNIYSIYVFIYIHFINIYYTCVETEVEGWSAIHINQSSEPRQSDRASFTAFFFKCVLICRISFAYKNPATLGTLKNILFSFLNITTMVRQIISDYDVLQNIIYLINLRATKYIFIRPKMPQICLTLISVFFYSK